MNKHKHFCFQNTSGVTQSVVVLLSACLIIISFVSGYFIALSANARYASGDPLIDDSVRPGSVRALSR